MTRWSKTVGAVAAVMVAVSLTGCSGATTTKGGDTTCKEYMAMSSDDQRDAVKALLSEKGKNRQTLRLRLRGAQRNSSA